jgi:WD40 repeat protein/serine/threonine protein kinase
MKLPDGREETLFDAARQLTNPAERRVFLNSACAGDPALLERLEVMLARQEQADRFFLEGQAALVPPRLAGTGEFEIPGCIIGKYKLLEKIGEGGYGIVYRAEQQEPVRRTVALKVIKLGMDTRSVVARFEAERQALALMDHPNIARVLDAGATETGRPFVVMELVRGTRITEYCDKLKIPTPGRLELFIQVCQAVQHAHQKGVIHRDLKPSNILVTENDGKAIPKVIDFGIAKATDQPLTEKALFTAFAQFLGTPAYMSPEQAGMTGSDIDTRADIYSLGVLLYELLTGRTPFDTQQLLKSGWEAMRRTICEQQPARPSISLGTMTTENLTGLAQRHQTEPARLVHQVRGDLDWIVMRCLEKDRGRRYQTANGLAMDIKRHLNTEPITARPPSGLYQFQKLIHRNRLKFTFFCLITVAVLTGAAVATLEAVRARRAEREQERLRIAAEMAQHKQAESQARAEKSAQESRRNLYAADIYLVQHALDDGNLGMAKRTLAEHRPRSGDEDLRSFEWRYFWRNCQGDKRDTLTGHSNIVTCLAFSPDHQFLASGSFDATVKLWEAHSHRLVTTFKTRAPICSLAFTSDGKSLVVSMFAGAVELCDLGTSEMTRIDFGMPCSRIAACPGRDLLAVSSCSLDFGGDGTVQLWEFPSRRLVKTLPHSGGRIVFSNDGKTLAIGGSDKITLVRLETGEERQFKVDTGNIYSINFSPDAKMLATTTTWGPEVKLWDAHNGSSMGTLIGHTSMAWCVAFSPDGQIAATGSSDQTVRLWNLASRKEIACLKGHLSEVWSAAFSPDGQSLFTGSKDETVIQWDAAPPVRSDRLTNVLAWPFWPVTAPDSKKIAAATTEHQVAVWNLETTQPIALFETEAFALGWSSNSDSLITLGTNGGLRLWDTSAHSIKAACVSPPGGKIVKSYFNPTNGRVLATGSEEGTCSLWNTETLGLTHQLKIGFTPGRAFALSLDAQTLAVSRDSNLEIWNVSTQQRVTVLKGHKLEISDSAFSADGKWIASSSSDGTVILWDRGTLQRQATLWGHRAGVIKVAFSRDSKSLGSCSEQMVKLLNIATLREMATFSNEEDNVWFLDFTPDGTALVFGNWIGSLQLLRAPLLSQIDQMSLLVPR